MTDRLDGELVRCELWSNVDGDAEDLRPITLCQ